ncbi:MAG: DUF134 domain-containing protein [Ignavibacteriales bacterium]|nr:DUF134 domain-containing protein [Ignavibacteriales bacterium]
MLEIIKFMPRPKKHRKINCNPVSYYFKPQGIPMTELEEIILDADELEALRLADLLAYSHERSAIKMKISRATFGRIVESARNKVVDAILHGKAIKIGNEFPAELKEKRTVKCKNCGSLKKNNSINNNETCHKCKRINKEN